MQHCGVNNLRWCILFGIRLRIYPLEGNGSQGYTCCADKGRGTYRSEHAPGVVLLALGTNTEWCLRIAQYNVSVNNGYLKRNRRSLWLDKSAMIPRAEHQVPVPSGPLHMISSPQNPVLLDPEIDRSRPEWILWPVEAFGASSKQVTGATRLYAAGQVPYLRHTTYLTCRALRSSLHNRWFIVCWCFWRAESPPVIYHADVKDYWRPSPRHMIYGPLN